MAKLRKQLSGKELEAHDRCMGARNVVCTNYGVTQFVREGQGVWVASLFAGLLGSSPGSGPGNTPPPPPHTPLPLSEQRSGATVD